MSDPVPATDARRPVVDPSVWPNVRGKRCAVLTAGDVDPQPLRVELDERGAASVDVLARLARTSGVGPAPASPYDVVVAVRVLHGAPSPAAVVAHLRAATRSILVSTEPIDLWLSVLARGRALVRLDADGTLVLNGSAHRQVLDAGGFAVERVGRPILVAGAVTPPGPLARLATRFLTGRNGDGELHRSLLCRVRPPVTG